MKIKIEDHYHFIVYILAGGLDEHWAKKIKARVVFEIGQILAGGRGRCDVIMDMAGVAEVSPGAVAELGDLERTLRKRGIGLALCKLPPPAGCALKKGKGFPEERLFPSVFAAKFDLRAEEE